MLITSYKISEVHFHLLGANGFYATAKNGRFTATGSRRRQNLKYEYFRSLFGRLHQKITAKSVPHVQHDYFSSFKQLNSLLGSFSKDNGNGTDDARKHDLNG